MYYTTCMDPYRGTVTSPKNPKPETVANKLLAKAGGSRHRLSARSWNKKGAISSRSLSPLSFNLNPKVPKGLKSYSLQPQCAKALNPKPPNSTQSFTDKVTWNPEHQIIHGSEQEAPNPKP